MMQSLSTLYHLQMTLSLSLALTAFSYKKIEFAFIQMGQSSSNFDNYSNTVIWLGHVIINIYNTFLSFPVWKRKDLC